MNARRALGYSHLHAFVASVPDACCGASATDSLSDPPAAAALCEQLAAPLAERLLQGLLWRVG